MPVNEYGQMIGEPMESYTPGELPSIDFLEGRYARIEALSVEKHAENLLAVYGPDTPREIWTYLSEKRLLYEKNQLIVSQFTRPPPPAIVGGQTRLSSA